MGWTDDLSDADYTHHGYRSTLGRTIVFMCLAAGGLATALRIRQEPIEHWSPQDFADAYHIQNIALEVAIALSIMAFISAGRWSGHYENAREQGVTFHPRLSRTH